MATLRSFLFTSEVSQIDHAQVVDVLSGTSAAAVVVHAMPAFDVSGEWSGADGVEESPRPGTGRRDYKVRSEEEREGERRARRGAHKGLNAEWGKLPSRASFKGFYGIKERVKSVWPSRAWASVD